MYVRCFLWRQNGLEINYSPIRISGGEVSRGNIQKQALQQEGKSSIWKRPWTCRKTEYWWMNEYHSILHSGICILMYPLHTVLIPFWVVNACKIFYFLCTIYLRYTPLRVITRTSLTS
jgi:uncharacterized membrane protein YesL